MISKTVQSFILVLIVTGLIAFPIVGLLLPPQPVLADVQTDEQLVRQAVVAALTHPSQPADANPRATHVAIVGDYALADWRLGEGGGEMLLMRQQGRWQKIAQTGGVMSSSWLIEQGIPESTAIQLVQRIQAQWTR
ncbi:MAG: hypothetical protein NW224_12250 [Leptolyngbyaceae cyanobacterium bins.302]|nr:hypothetical protein [Leptolyngbyaceae cyanobacterium bins.302]